MIRSFIFSDDKQSRRLRHLSFWIILYLLLSYNNLTSITRISDFFRLESYIDIWITTSYWFVLLVGAVQLFSRVIIPRYLITKHYRRLIIASVLGWLSLFFVAWGMAYVDDYKLSQIVCHCDDKGSWVTTLFLAIYYTVVINIPLSIILMAYHFVKAYHQEQTLQTLLLNERTENEINAQRNKVLPEYLLSSIKSLSLRSKEQSMNHSKLILLFSNVLSYILYESNAATVCIDKEIEIVQDLIEFENILDKQQIRVQFKNKTGVRILQVVPLQLISPVIDLFLHQRSKLQHNSTAVLIVSDQDCRIEIDPVQRVDMQNEILYSEEDIQT